MKAKTTETSCFHKKYTSIIYDNGGGRLVYINPTDTTKRMANVNTRQFNSALSDHVAKETAPLLAEIDRLKKEVERLESGKWISVGERLPDKTDRYLVMLKYPAGGLDFAICVFYNDHRKYFDHFLEDRITHWQPLPQPK